MQPPKNIEAKVVVLGTQGVGKTSIVHRYTAGHFTSLPSTIGASFLVKKLVVQAVRVRLQIWDTAGQERFRSMTPMYYRGSHAAIIVYDITSRQSFDDVRQWIEGESRELRNNMTSDLIIHVVGSKLDLASHSRAVDLEEAKRTINSWVRPRVEERQVDSNMGRQTTSSRSSRLGFGSLTMSTTASRLGFAGPSNSAANNSGGSNGSGSGSGGRTEAAVEEEVASAWDSIEVSEVSAKDDEGIEDVFLAITRRLVERKTQLERERARRDRESIMLSEPEHDDHARQLANSKASNGWSCC